VPRIAEPAASLRTAVPAAVSAPVPAPAPAHRAVTDSAAAAVTAVLTYADQVLGLQGPELLREIAGLGEPAAAADQVRLAIALSQTHQLYDLANAQQRLQRVLSSDSEEARPLQPLARLLAARYVEQRRVEDLLDRQNQQLRELQRRFEQTRDQLEALKAIERSLNNRPAEAPPLSTPARRARNSGL
jgi:septal ring factor EnvC (AmiA/AmiB activator)